jgi:imidazolonepropionase
MWSWVARPWWAGDVRRLYNIGRLFTGTAAGVVPGAAIIFEGDRIAWCGHEGSEPRVLLDAVTDDYDCGGGLVTAGLIDAHTHPLYAGDRLAEVAMRTAGASYAEIAKAGGGIKATVKSTRAASVASLETATASRLSLWFDGGTTTVEAKTGYHLTREGELGAVRILKRLSERANLPRLEVTFLAAHAAPPDRGATLAGYAGQVAGWCRDAQAAGARFCDVFCDQGYFTVAQSRKILTAAVDAKLIPRVHADELARTGGSRLAAEVHAASADHLLCADRNDAKALARAGVTATLAPVTALSMGKLPPVRQLMEAGANIALGTDHNPGTSGITSMSLVIALAVGVFKMSAEQALLAATVGGAQSLALSDRGSVTRSMLADVVLWDAEHEGAFVWAFGLVPRQVWKGGAPVV